MSDKLNIEVGDLCIICEKCGGSGHLSETPARTGNNVGPHVFYTSGPCDKCGGRGVSLTNSGKALLEFSRILKDKFP